MATRSRTRLSASDKYYIWKRSGGVCHICRESVSIGENWEADHVRSVYHGASDDLDEYRAAHRDCNRIKGRDSFL